MPPPPVSPQACFVGKLSAKVKVTRKPCICCDVHPATVRRFTDLPSPPPHPSPLFQRVFVDECKFRETLLPNNYNAYESFVYKGFYVALSRHGRVKRGNRATTAMTVTHFLPRL